MNSCLWLLLVLLLVMGVISWWLVNQQRRGFQKLFDDQVRRESSVSILAPLMPDIVAGEIVVGKPLGGDLVDEWIRESVFTYPSHVLRQHLVIVGGTGSGKTVTASRIAYGVARYLGWQVIFINAKGDSETAQEFMGLMKSADIRCGAFFPELAYGGWRGDSTAIINRLMAIEDYSEPYYKSVAKKVITLAVRAGEAPPRSAQEFLARLDVAMLKDWYRGTPEAQVVQAIKADELQGVHNRYWAFFAALDGKLDGQWAFEDVAVAHVLLDGTALKEEAQSLGRFLVEDFSHYVAVRKAKDRRVLFILDEFSALSMHTDAANLFERIRSLGGSVIVTSQSYAGLGTDAERILDAAAGLIVHQENNPEELVSRAGTTSRMERSIQVDDEGPTGLGSMRLQDTYRVHPDSARQLEKGQCFVVCRGRAQRVQIAPAPAVSAKTTLHLSWGVEPLMMNHSRTEKETVPSSDDATVCDAPASIDL